MKSIQTGAVAGILALSGCYQGLSSGSEPGQESGDPPAENACAPGEAQACACEDGSEGEQICADDGLAYETCQCGVIVEGCETPSAGAAPLPRLTRSQYANTVEDLLRIDAAAVADGLAGDERVGPFTSNVGIPVAELHLEQYMAAAETLAADAAQDLTSLVPCDPASGDEVCAEAFLREFLPRAFRRPVTDADVQSILDVYAAAPDFPAGIRVALQAVLQSPYFLYRVELGDPDRVFDETIELTSHEYAARLSFFLWDTMPDEALADAAGAGDLDDVDLRRAHVDRLLADPRAARAIARFHVEWLAVVELDALDKDDPRYDADLADAMARETADFANYVLHEDDGRLETLLTADYTVTDDPALLELYGAGAGDPVLLDGDERSGLLTQAGFLAAHSHPDQSSPVKRGVVIRENVFCQSLPPPPPNVDNVPPEPDPNATTRERFAEHTKDPVCAACHLLIDGVGFGFEQYDALGEFRAVEGGGTIDASGEIIGTDVDGEFDGAVELGAVLAGSDEVRDCVATQWLRFALGRGEMQADQCTSDALRAAFEDSDGDVRELIREIALSDSFRHMARGDQ